MPYRWLAPMLLMLLAMTLTAPPRAQPPTPGSSGKGLSPSDLEIVERLLVIRRDYQKTLEALRTHYLNIGDLERGKWAEEELRQYHRIPKPAYRLELDVPPPNLVGNTNIVEANKLYTRALAYKDKGWGTDYLDNQRRAELLFQELITRYPQSDKISDAAYQLGDIYESKAYRQHRRAAHYFERCFQWNPRTQFDARIRAARLYDRHLTERGRAIELYKEVATHDTDPQRLQEAQKRMTELSGKR